MNNGFRDYNGTLRTYPDERALINEVLETAPPLDKEIVVYRYTNQELQLGELRSYGYLSVSYSATFVFQAALRSRSRLKVMRIRVPAGQRCIYTFSHESELIFPHNLLLDVVGERQQDSVTVYEVEVVPST